MLDADNKPLFLEKRKIDREEMEFTIVVAAKPARAGIDPYNKLIDRRPKDNAIPSSCRDALRRSARQPCAALGIIWGRGADIP